MGPSQHESSNFRYSESTSWVPLKGKTNSLGRENSTFPRGTKFSSPRDSQSLPRIKRNAFKGYGFLNGMHTKIQAEENSLIQNNCKNIIDRNKICINSVKKTTGGSVKKTTGGDINNVEIKIISKSNVKTTNGELHARKSPSRQPMKSFCCCWTVQKEQIDGLLSDSGGPVDGRAGGGEGGNDGLARNSSTRGSLRKVLPSVPDMDQQLSMSAKMIDRRTSTPKGNHSYSPYFLEYTLLAEYNVLQKQCVPGVYVVPSASSPLAWFGVIFLRQGPYQEGIFRFTLHIPENFPDGDVPSVVFETKVFHPLVDMETGELDVKRGFSNKWRRNLNHLWHVLTYLKKCFYKIETNNPLNSEAATLYESNNELFLSHVKECVTASKEGMYNPPSTSDSHAMIFTPYEPSVHDPVRDELKKERNNGATSGKDVNNPGLSWVKPSTLQIFSKSAS